MHILPTVLYSFPKVLTRRICLTIKSFLSWWSFPSISWPQCVIQWWYCTENLFNNQELLKLVIISFNLMTLMCDSVVILYGEIRCYSLFGVKRFKTKINYRFALLLVLFHFMFPFLWEWFKWVTQLNAPELNLKNIQWQFLRAKPSYL